MRGEGGVRGFSETVAVAVTGKGNTLQEPNNLGAGIPARPHIPEAPFAS